MYSDVSHQFRIPIRHAFTIFKISRIAAIVWNQTGSQHVATSSNPEEWASIYLQETVSALMTSNQPETLHCVTMSSYVHESHLRHVHVSYQTRNRSPTVRGTTPFSSTPTSSGALSFNQSFQQIFDAFQIIFVTIKDTHAFSRSDVAKHFSRRTEPWRTKYYGRNNTVIRYDHSGFFFREHNFSTFYYIW